MSGFRGTLSIIPPPSNMNGTISEMHPPGGPLGQQEISQIREQNVDDEMVCSDFISLGKSSHFKQKRLRSEVWKHFEKYRDKNGKDRAKCNLCKRDFDGSSKKGTTHLKNHLKICQKKRNGGGGGDKATELGNLTRSDVWKKFEKYKDENGKDWAKCNLCEICQKQINGVRGKPAEAARRLVSSGPELEDTTPAEAAQSNLRRFTNFRENFICDTTQKQINGVGGKPVEATRRLVSSGPELEDTTPAEAARSNLGRFTNFWEIFICDTTQKQINGVGGKPAEAARRLVSSGPELEDVWEPLWT